MGSGWTGISGTAPLTIDLMSGLADGNGFDDRLFVGGHQAVPVGVHGVGADLIDDLHTFCHEAEARVLAVQEGAVRLDDEELGAGAVHVHRARHGDRAADVGDRVLEAVDGEFPGDRLLRAAGSPPCIMKPLMMRWKVRPL